MRLKITAFLIILTTVPSFGQKTLVSGKVIDKNREPIPFSTVIFIAKSDSTQLYTAISNDDGVFAASLPYNHYKVEARCLGYHPAQIDELDATGTQPVELPDIVLEASVTNLTAAVVQANTIERRADRFIVNLSASPVSQGRSLHESLSFLPGVTTNNGISINGKSGTRVMVNNRMLNMSSDQIEQYLKNLRASDIQRIEVIPDAGAEYDANATGGIIKITLKQQTVTGYYGSISADIARAVDYTQSSRPNVNFSFRKDKWSVISNAYYSLFAQPDKFNEQIDFYTTQMNVSNTNTTYTKSNTAGGEVSAVYDINHKQSTGFVVNYTYSKNKVNTDGTSITSTPGFLGTYINDNRQYDKYNRLGLTANYIHKLDSTGSTLTVLADYIYNSNDNGGTFNTFYHVVPLISSALFPFDTLSYRNNIVSNNNIFSANIDVDIKLRGRSNLKAGGKFFRSRIANDILYEDWLNRQWVMNDRQTDNFTYTESVSALYATFSSSFAKRWLYTMGLRAEHTLVNLHSIRHQEKTNQNYLNLFPTLNLSFQENPQKGHTLSLMANRRIIRPSFSLLLPYSVPLNDFSIVLGSPDLKPAKSFNISLTQTLFHKYSLTLGTTYIKDFFNQMAIEKEDEPDILYFQFINMNSRTQWYAAIYTPVSIFKWWTLISNVVGVYLKDQYTILGKEDSNQKPFIQANISSNFTLPKGWKPELSAMYMTGVIQGNFTTKPMYFIHAGCTKSLLKDKLMVTLRVNNVIYNKLHLTIQGDTYQKSIKNSIDRRTLQCSIRYAFNSAQRVQVKKVATGAEEEKARLK